MADDVQPLSDEKARRLLAEWPIAVTSIERIDIHNTNFIKATVQTVSNT